MINLPRKMEVIYASKKKIFVNVLHKTEITPQ